MQRPAHAEPLENFESRARCLFGLAEQREDPDALHLDVPELLERLDAGIERAQAVERFAELVRLDEALGDLQMQIEGELAPSLPVALAEEPSCDAEQTRGGSRGSRCERDLATEQIELDGGHA